MVLLRQEKWKSAVHRLRRHAPYSVVEKKGTIVMAERASGGKTVVRNTSDFKGYLAPTEKRTRDGLLNVDEEPTTCKVEPTQPSEGRGAVCGLR